MVTTKCARCPTMIECWPYRVGKAVCAPCLREVKAENGRLRGATQPKAKPGDTNIRWFRGKPYMMRFMPDHPDTPGTGWMMEHRLVMEREVDRRLTSDEIVHHRDRNGLNNDPLNLEIEADRGTHLATEHCMEGVAARIANMPLCPTGCGRYTQHGSDKCWPCWSASQTCPKCGREGRKMARRDMCHGCYKAHRKARHGAPTANSPT